MGHTKTTLLDTTHGHALPSDMPSVAARVGSRLFCMPKLRAVAGSGRRDVRHSLDEAAIETKNRLSGH